MSDNLPPLPEGAVKLPPLPEGASQFTELPSTSKKTSSPDITLGGRLKEVGKQTISGGVAGALAPEILQGVGYGMQAVPPVAPFAPLVIGAGRAMRGQRLASAVTGAVGGGVGETAGQVIEAQGGNPLVAETGRFLGGMTGPSTVRAMGSGIGKLVSPIFNKVIPGFGTAIRTIGQLAEERGIKEIPLPAEKAKFIEEKLAAIRGGAESTQHAKDVFGILRGEASAITQQADNQAAALQRQADDLIAGAQSQQGPARAQLEQQVNRLYTQLNDAGAAITSTAKQQADQVRQQAQQVANAIRDRAAQAPNLRDQATDEARRVMLAADSEAAKIETDAAARAAKMNATRDRLRSSTQSRLNEVAASRAGLGSKVGQSDLGKSVRTFFMKEFERLKTIRQQNVEKLKAAAFDDASAKEVQGARYQETEAYRNAVSGIDQTLKSEAGLYNVGPDEINGLTKIKDVLVRGVGRKIVDPATGEKTIKYTPLSFQALENMRRQLRDRAFGLPAEGYDAIGQQQATKLADYIEGIQKEFSPNFEKYLAQYKIDSQPLNEFKNRLGKAIIGKSESDFGQFATDEFNLASQAFKSSGTVDQLIKVAGNKEAEQLARSFVANKMVDGTPREIKAIVNDASISDWIDKFPALKNEINSLAERAGIAERIAKRRSTLADTLRTQIAIVPTSASKAAGTVKTKAEIEAANLLKRGETQATKLEQQAEKGIPAALAKGETQAGKIENEAEKQIAASAAAAKQREEALMTEMAAQQKARETAAEQAAAPLTKEAAKIQKEAQAKADLILGTKEAPERIAGLLLNANRDEMAVIAPIIKNAPGGREKLGKAIGQTIANRANQSLKGAIADTKAMGDRLVDNGLMSRSEVDKLVAKLEEIYNAPIKPKATFVQNLIKDAITGAVSQVTRPIPTTFKEK